MEEILTCSNCQLEFTWSFEYGRLAKEITADQKERSQRIVEAVAAKAKAEAEKERKRWAATKKRKAAAKKRTATLARNAAKKKEEAKQRRRKWENDLLKQLSPVLFENNSAKKKFHEWLGSECLEMSDEQRDALVKLDDPEHPWVRYRLQHDHLGNKYKVGDPEYLEFHESAFWNTIRPSVNTTRKSNIEHQKTERRAILMEELRSALAPFFVKKGDTVRQLSSSELRTAVANGEFAPYDLIRKSEKDKWTKLSEVKGLDFPKPS
mgnify:CR=1 FL=1